MIALNRMIFSAEKTLQAVAMQQINQFGFYEIGKVLRKILDSTNETDPATAFWSLDEAKEKLEKILAGNPIPIVTSRQEAQDALTVIDRIINDFFRADNGNFRIPESITDSVPTWRWRFLHERIEKFETVFSAEMRESVTYHIPRRGLYYTPALVDYAEDSFPHHLREIIPIKTKQDWRSAGRCVAFNLHSAAGFHVARAVEGALESYWQIAAQREAGATLKSWHDYVKDLSRLRALASSQLTPSERVIAELDQMRQDFRNPIMHPRVVLMEADSRILFLNGESLILLMSQEIEKYLESTKVPTVSATGLSTILTT